MGELMCSRSARAPRACLSFLWELESPWRVDDVHGRSLCDSLSPCSVAAHNHSLLQLNIIRPSVLVRRFPTPFVVGVRHCPSRRSKKRKKGKTNQMCQELEKHKTKTTAGINQEMYQMIQNQTDSILKDLKTRTGNHGFRQIRQKNGSFRFTAVSCENDGIHRASPRSLCWWVSLFFFAEVNRHAGFEADFALFRFVMVVAP